MNFTQLIPFDQSKGGHVPNLCLNNVRLGYGIANKYASAWEAWEHTEQHPDRNVPAGLDVPLYYSYTTTLDGVTQNYGHINVQLKNGTVWSDGNIYSSIDAYTVNHLPKFVGWGESINDIKVIGEDMADDNFITLAWQAGFNRPPRDDERAAMQGLTCTQVEQHVLNNNEDFRSKAANYDAYVASHPDTANAVTLKPGLYTVE